VDDEPISDEEAKRRRDAYYAEQRTASKARWAEIHAEGEQTQRGRKVEREGKRYDLCSTDSPPSYSIWDHSPRQVAAFDRTPDGWAKAWAEFQRLDTRGFGLDRAAIIGLVTAAFIVGLVVVVALVSGGHGGSGGGISGRYVGWIPVDTAHGYALVRLTNDSDSENTANCTVQVMTDFGDAGFDAIEQPLAPHESRTFRVGLIVQNNAAFRVSSGSVSDC
jgi:hypothetical protein